MKDVVAHLLDGNIRVLSMLRDGYSGEKPNGQSYQELLDFLNGLNADWVKAMKRVSPAMLIFLHEVTGHLYTGYYASLDPFGKSPFPVAWAGEKESFNWMQIAREYTEKWLHQQHVRYVVNDTALMTREYYYPFMDIFMFGLPHTYRNVQADDGAIIKITISTGIGGCWFLIRSGGKWMPDKNISALPLTEIIIHPDIAWRLFSKSIMPDEISDKIIIKGNRQLGEVVLTMVSVMA